MKAALLAALKAAGEQYVSGADISRQLGVSRNAVWKHIGLLRRDGYVIQAVPHRGYRLVHTPDSLPPEEVMPALGTVWLGRHYHYLRETGSTNSVARDLARKGAPEGTLVLAEQQVKGRGRMGRYWSSPRGGLWFSLVLRPPVHPSSVQGITFVAALACAQALAVFPGVNPRIKWPNDVLLDGRKVAGILTELSAETDRVNHVVVGVGINVNVPLTSLPPVLRETANSVAAVLGRDVSRREVLTGFLDAMEAWYQRWLQEGLPPVLDAWKKWDNSLGKKVRVVDAQGDWQGIALDVDSLGALIVEQSPGVTRRVLAGDILLQG